MDLLERESALVQLNAALPAANGEQGCVVLVSGEAGIGKTALIEQFRATRPPGMRVLFGACESLFTPRPFGPLLDMAAQTGDDLRALLHDEPTHSSLFYAVLAELQRTPTIAIIEDLHWADAATLDLIKFVGRRIRTTASVLLLTYRDDEVDPGHPLRRVLGELGAATVTRRIALAPLSLAAVRQLVGDQPYDALELHRQTGGNPFFVTETLASGDPGISASIRDAVLARAARLAPESRAVLDVAAVIGQRIEPRLLLAVLGAGASAVEPCVSLGMLVGQGDLLAFRHELARQVILEAISPQQRLALHRVVLARLETRPTARSDVARLAYHAEAANDRAAVWEYALDAARQASAASSHREAAAHYARLLRFAEGLPPEEHARALEAYAQECNIIDQVPNAIGARQTAAAIWQTTGDLLRQGENLARLAGLQVGIGQTAAADQSSDAAIALLEPLPPSRELGVAYRIAGTLCAFRNDSDDAIRLCERAIALAERFADTETLAMAYNIIGCAYTERDYDRARAALEHSRTIALQAGVELRVATAYANLGSGAAEVYRFAEAERYLNEGIGYTQERDIDAARLYMQAWLALTYLHTGRWDAATEQASAVLAHPGVASVSRIMALVALASVRFRRGDTEVAALLDEALELAEDTTHLLRLGTVRAARAEAAWLRDDLALAEAEARAAYDLALSKAHPWIAGALGGWRWRAGTPLTLPDWAAPPFRQLAAGDWRAAAASWQALGCPYERALALSVGDHAAQLAALAIFEQVGATPAAHQVRNRLRSISARQREKAVYGGLTARERHTARLIAQGHSNREIANTMHVSVKTIETYVTRILAKLDFETRVQIATWAVENGLRER